MSASPWRSLPIPLSHLSLPLLLRAGQSFRWLLTPPSPAAADAVHRQHAVFSLTLRDRVVQLAQPSEHEISYRHISPSGLGSGAAGPGLVDVKPSVKSKVGTAAQATSSTTPAALPDEATTAAWLADYFQLDVDSQGLWDQWRSLDPVFPRRESQLLRGIRVLKMDVWECLFSFICSSNNNISRITLMVNAAASSFSPPLLSAGDTVFHPFPPPSAFLAADTEARLRALGFGYRAAFIHRTAVALCEAQPTDPEGWLREVVREWPEEERAREALMEFVGVGRKVADCVLLMSGGDRRKHIVPVDVHVLRIAQKLYGYSGASKSGQKVSMTPPLYASVEASLRERWGPHAGWVQAVLFASDLPALLKSEPAVKVDVAEPTLSVLAPVPCQPMLSPDGTPPPPFQSVKREPSNIFTAPLAFLSTKRTAVVTKAGGGDVVKLEAREVEIGAGLEGANSLGERVKKRRRTAASASASVKTETRGR